MNDVANRYAIALLDIAREEGNIKGYIDIAKTIIKIFDDNEDLNILLKAYGLSKDEKKDIVNKIFKDIVNQYILNLMYIIIDNNRSAITKDIFEDFCRISLNELNIKSGVVYTTIPLDKSTISKLEKKVSSILNANVTLQNVIDKSLVGGFKIKVDDYLLDDTITNRLNKIKENLLSKGENTWK